MSRLVAPERQGAKAETPGSKFAGGHRIRVTPVPIPNTEVKPHTADGTAWETVWESRSLPALFVRKPASFGSRAFVLYLRPRHRYTVSHALHGAVLSALPRTLGDAGVRE